MLKDDFIEKNFTIELAEKQYDMDEKLAREGSFEGPPLYYRIGTKVAMANGLSDLMHFKNDMLEVYSNNSIIQFG